MHGSLVFLQHEAIQVALGFQSCPDLNTNLAAIPAVYDSTDISVPASPLSLTLGSVLGAFWTLDAVLVLYGHPPTATQLWVISRSSNFTSSSKIPESSPLVELPSEKQNRALNPGSPLPIFLPTSYATDRVLSLVPEHKVHLDPSHLRPSPRCRVAAPDFRQPREGGAMRQRPRGGGGSVRPCTFPTTPLGTIPGFLGGFPRLRELSLSFNRFMGAIPGELGAGCQGLEHPDLSANLLVSSLPGSLGNCSELRSLTPSCHSWPSLSSWTCGSDGDGTPPRPLSLSPSFTLIHITLESLPCE